jgi:hypothetical protein
VTTALERAGDRAPIADLSAAGWTGLDLPYDEWLRQGSRLGLAGRNASWWIGDWLRYGTARYGSKYTAAARVTGYDRQTLMNMVYVATRFEISRRRENLSWSHHAELAALEDAEQNMWLERAAVERLSVRDLREELGAHRETSARAARESPPSRSATQRTVVCPHCGENFTP